MLITCRLLCHFHTIKRNEGLSPMSRSNRIQVYISDICPFTQSISSSFDCLFREFCNQIVGDWNHTFIAKVIWSITKFIFSIIEKQECGLPCCSSRHRHTSYLLLVSKCISSISYALCFNIMTSIQNPSGKNLVQNLLNMDVF